MIELCVKCKLLLDSIDAWLLTQDSLINKRKKTLLPVVRERQTLADGLARYLTTLGLDRVVPPPKFPWEVDEKTEPVNSDQVTETADHDGSSDTEGH